VRAAVRGILELQVARLDSPTQVRERGGDMPVVVDVSGFEPDRLIADLRAQTESPIVALCSNDEADGRVVALEAGATYALSATASAREIAAALRAVCPSLTGSFQRVGRISLDHAGADAYVDGALVRLTATEFALLAALAREPGRVMDGSQLAVAMGRSSMAPGALRVHLSNLRRKLGDAADQLETVRGAGHVLHERQRQRASSPAVVRGVLATLDVSLKQRSISPETLGVLLRFRRPLMVRALTRASRRFTPSDLARLRAGLDDLAASTYDPVRFINAERRCAMVVLGAADDRILGSVFREFTELVERCGWIRRTTRDSALIAVETYRQMLALAERRDRKFEQRVEALIQRMDEHIARTAVLNA